MTNKRLLCLTMFILVSCVQAGEYTVKSPDGHITASSGVIDRALFYSTLQEGRPVVSSSDVGAPIPDRINPAFNPSNLNFARTQQ